MNTTTVGPKGIDDALAQGMKPKAKDPNKVLREVDQIANLVPEEAQIVSRAVEIWKQLLPPNETQRRLEMEVWTPLLRLPSVSRVKVINAISKALGLSTKQVRELLGDFERRQNPKTENEETLWEKVEPYPEPVLLQQVLDDLCEYIRAYVVLEPYYVHILALWVVMTWVFDKFMRLPILLVTSPAHESGKTTLFLVLSKVVRKGILNVQTTSAIFFRVIHKDHPTLFIDEADTLLRENKDLTDIINASHTKGIVVLRCDPETYEPKPYDCFAPVALAGNNPTMAPATRSRCITITLKRKLPTEHCEKLGDGSELKEHAKQVASLIARAIQDITPLLEQQIKRREDLPGLKDLNNRALDLAKPLAIIALIADLQAYGRIVKDGWFERAVTAIKTVVANSTDTEAKHIQLLRDIKTVFDQTQDKALPSKDLLTKLKQLDGSPWDDLTERTLAKMLKPFEVNPKVIRLGDKTPRGYERQSFEDPWKRYL
jgi:hypothetical protein